MSGDGVHGNDDGNPHAVDADADGIPGVSGDENANGPPTFEGFAKLPGVVPALREEGLEPRRG